MIRSCMRKTLLVTFLAMVIVHLCSCASYQDKQTQSPEPILSDTLNPESIPENNGNPQPPLTEIPPEAFITPDELNVLLNNDSCLVFDTRTYLEYAKASIPQAANLPLRFLERRQAEIPRDTTVAFIVESKNELTQVYSRLLDIGFDSRRIKMLEGGIDAWIAAGYKVENDDILPC